MGKKQVFILTGSQVPNVVNIGNDYLLIYNKKHKLTKKEKLHNTLLQFKGKSDDPGKSNNFNTPFSHSFGHN